jgi:hypothetical protein
MMRPVKFNASTVVTATMGGRIASCSLPPHRPPSMAALRLVSLAVLGGATAASPTPPVQDDLELVPTPYGMRPKRCVLEVPDGSHVDEDELGVVVTHPELGTIRHTADPLCSLAEHAPRPSLHMYQELPAPPPMNRSVAHCDIPPCTCEWPRLLDCLIQQSCVAAYIACIGC